MNIIKHKSAFPSVFGDDMDNLFQGFFRPVSHLGLSTKNSHLPAVDIDESETNYFLMAELPGFNKEDINISFDNGLLTIKAEHNEETEKKQKEGNIIKERRFGSFFRSFNFGNNIAEGDISAQYKNGVLELTIPKSSEVEDKAKKIEIN
jgi:HSP20 family protein